MTADDASTVPVTAVVAAVVPVVAVAAEVAGHSRCRHSRTHCRASSPPHPCPPPRRPHPPLGSGRDHRRIQPTRRPVWSGIDGAERAGRGVRDAGAGLECGIERMRGAGGEADCHSHRT